MQNFSFGSIESEYDKRTVTADMLATAGTVELKSKGKVPLDFYPVNELSNQKKIGKCTQCAVRIGSEETLKNGVKTSDSWGYLMQKYFYDDVQFGRHFEGSSIMTALKTRKNYGCPSVEMENKYPLYIDGTYSEFITDWRSKYGGKIPKEILEDASKNKIKGYYSVPVDPISIAKEISTGHVLMARFTVGENTYKARDGRVSWSETDLMPLRKPLYIEGGHAMCINEYDGLDENQLDTGPNSWSDKWGKKGYYYFYFKDQIGYLTELWAIDDIPQDIIENIKKISFSKDLYFGITHPDVKRLQQYLNDK